MLTGGQKMIIVITVVSLGLAIFPLQGLELKFVSIAALSFSIWWAMRNINKASCCTMENN